MQVKSIAECSPILSTFIVLPFAVKSFVLSIFERPFKTGFTVSHFNEGEPSGSVVKCLTQDRGAAGSSLTEVTALCP